MTEPDRVQIDVTYEFNLIYQQVLQELSGRVEREMSERDTWAVCAAVRKALLRSKKVLVHRVNEAHAATHPGAELPLPPDEDDVEEDLWADRYGPGAEGESSP